MHTRLARPFRMLKPPVATNVKDEDAIAADTERVSGTISLVAYIDHAFILKIGMRKKANIMTKPFISLAVLEFKS